ncbi:hypothetical protein TNCV_4106611 [Trichonephila clavipes]|nr:hypothetical protein TNCV_4106611 [Trichonephila clavipes]
MTVYDNKEVDNDEVEAGYRELHKQREEEEGEKKTLTKAINNERNSSFESKPTVVLDTSTDDSFLDPARNKVRVKKLCLPRPRIIGDGPRNFEQWSSEERATPELAHPFPNFRTTPMGGRLSLDIFNVHRPPLHGGSQLF